MGAKPRSAEAKTCADECDRTLKIHTTANFQRECEGVASDIAPERWWVSASGDVCGWMNKVVVLVDRYW